MKALVEGVKINCLIFDIRYHLNLLKTFYVLSILRNLVSLSKLGVARYFFNFGNRCFNLFKHKHLISSIILCDRLYKLNLDSLYTKILLTLHHNVSRNHNLANECLAHLWHKHLEHISKERIERLVNNESLLDLDFTNLNFFVNCINGKQVKHTKKKAMRST